MQPPGAGFCICYIVTALLQRLQASFCNTMELHTQTPMEIPLLSEGTGNVPGGAPSACADQHGEDSPCSAKYCQKQPNSQCQAVLFGQMKKQVKTPSHQHGLPACYYSNMGGRESHCSNGCSSCIPSAQPCLRASWLFSFPWSQCALPAQLCPWLLRIVRQSHISWS